ncbi:MAG: DUF3108 domain-containing protein [Flavobacteriales bacterium]|nr:DUF3108 domain-containing protein [Flavobacteriales bacterium]
MKRFALFLLVITGLAATTPFIAPTEVDVEETLIYKALPKAKIAPFKKGEKLNYKLAYGILGGGSATIEIRNETKKLGNKTLLHIVGTGQSSSFWDAFYKVRDRYETFVEEDTFHPRLFLRDVDEGGYQFKQDYKFYPEKQVVKTQDKKEYTVPTNVQDMMSAFFYARTFDFTNIKKGDIVTVQSFVDDEIFPLSIKFLGTEEVKVKSGKINCMKFTPLVQQGRIFKTEDDLTVWISNDANKIPVKAEAKILIGSVTMELTQAEGLAN